ncbi:hypothetical protein DW973_18955 [Parabacteroides merdae]|jgi:hypothetical protein|uniref:Phosphoinositide-interacting protein family n=1 Tax=Siphoviridae sp. ctZ0X1 TaxID=2825554 RepID=A0A8S5QDX1_9CAUD|nr:hypothetical protein DW973_18955 [Parabacteroides merdae]DAE17001.1 MAG TPA: Phosphoinositide-interacting protein family [Siphoviridae sp. ctZ0X1]
MKVNIKIIAMLLTVPFLISICIGGLFLIAGIVLKALGYLFSFAPKLAKKEWNNYFQYLR